MGLLKKLKRIVAPVVGFAIGGPVGAAAGLALSEGSHAVKKNARNQKKAMRSQEEILAQYERQANEQAEIARREREELQRQESDMIRAKRKKGRRSLMDQTQVNNEPSPLRRTLG